MYFRDADAPANDLDGRDVLEGQVRLLKDTVQGLNGSLKKVGAQLWGERREMVKVRYSVGAGRLAHHDFPRPQAGPSLFLLHHLPPSRTFELGPGQVRGEIDVVVHAYEQGGGEGGSGGGDKGGRERGRGQGREGAGEGTRGGRGGKEGRAPSEPCRNI